MIMSYLSLLIKRLQLFVFGARHGVSFAWLSKKMVIYPNLQSLQESSEREFARLSEIEIEANQVYEAIVVAKSGLVTNKNWDAEKSLCVLLYAHILQHRPRTIVETGVANGITTNVIMAALEQTGGQLHSYDILPSAESVYTGTGHWTFHLLRSRNRFKEMSASAGALGPVQLWIHDSNHGYTWQKFEYGFAFEVLDSPGWLISDDIDASPAFGEIAEHSGIHSFGLVDKRELIGVARRTFT